MSYDLLTLPFGLAVALGCFKQFGRFRDIHVAPIIQLVCGIFIIIGGRAGERLLFDFYCMLILSLAAFAIYIKYQGESPLQESNSIGIISLSL